MTKKFEFNQAALDRLIENRIGFYKGQEATHNSLGAIVIVSGDTPAQYLENVMVHGSRGHTLAPVDIHHTHSYCRCYMYKPAAVQAKEIEELKAQVEAQYLADLEADKQKFIKAEARRLFEEKQLQDKEKLAALEVKQLEKIEKELAAAMTA